MVTDGDIDIWDIVALAERLGGIEPASVRRAVQFWVDYGVLRSNLDGVYTLQEGSATDQAAIHHTPQSMLSTGVSIWLLSLNSSSRKCGR